MQPTKVQNKFKSRNNSVKHKTGGDQPSNILTNTGQKGGADHQ